MKVIRALQARGSKDFWPLTRTSHLARETKDFVPQIQAAVMIGRDPGRYGFEVKDPEPLGRSTAWRSRRRRICGVLASAAGMRAPTRSAR